MRHALALVVGLFASMAAAQDLPSGRAAALFDLVVEPATDTARFRFVMPGLAAGDHAVVAADMPWLCEQVALPELDANGWTVAHVVISLGDRELPLGQMDDSAVQFFESYDVSAGTCILEVF